MSDVANPIAASDVLIVGAGVVGLAHAAEALARGLTVTVIDRDARAVGASIRNFGHACVTAQSGHLLDLALVAREKWLGYSRDAGFFSIDAGALTIARSATELLVLEQLAASREPGQVKLLSRAETQSTLTVNGDDGIVGGALLRDDLRVDPRQAVGGLAAWLESRGVTFLWQTSYLGHDDGVTRTSRGTIISEHTIVCVGHDLSYLFPELAAQHEVQRCGLQMALVEAPSGMRLSPAVLTGTSMLRYPAFAETQAAAELKTEITDQTPELIDVDANVMFTQRPDGTLLVGDSHRYDITMDPFLAESTYQTLIAAVARLLGMPSLKVLQRWQGVYAWSPQHPYLVAHPQSDLTVVTVTSGVGMTISMGLAREVWDDLGA